MILKFPDPVTVRDLPEGFVALEFETGEFILAPVAVIRKYEHVEPPTPEQKYQRLVQMMKEMALPESIVAPPPVPPPVPPTAKVVRSSRNEDEVFTPYATVERCNEAVKILLSESSPDDRKNSAIKYLMGCPTYMWMQSDAVKLPKEIRTKMAQQRNFDTAGGDPNLLRYMPADLGSFASGQPVITYDGQTPASDILPKELGGQVTGQILQRAGQPIVRETQPDPDPLAWLNLK